MVMGRAGRPPPSPLSLSPSLYVMECGGRRWNGRLPKATTTDGKNHTHGLVVTPEQTSAAGESNPPTSWPVPQDLRYKGKYNGAYLQKP